MRDKIILGITLTVVLLLTLLIYLGVDAQRGPAALANAREEAITNGRHIYAKYCIQCHGPKAEGCIGPALNRDVWRAEKDGAPNPAFDSDSTAFILKTVTRGRASNQPGVQMPAWGENEGGSLTDQEVANVVTFIQYGDMDTVLEEADSAVGLDKDLPPYIETGYQGGDATAAKAGAAKVKSLMLAKGCFTCHQLGGVGGRVAAELTDVGSRRSADWLKRWIHDPSAMPASERGPNLWLVAPTPGLYTPAASASPSPTPNNFPMNTTFMPTIKMTDDQLAMLVDYLSHARTTTK